MAKTALFRPKNANFGSKSIFCGQAQKNCYHQDGTPKEQPILRGPHCRVVSGEAAGPFFGPKNGPNIRFFTLHPYNTPVLVSDGPDSMGS